MTFAEATEALKAGKKVRRAEWTQQNSWLELIPGTPTDMSPLRLDMWMEPAGGRKSLLWAGWLASGVEEQADDWQIVS